MTQSLTNLMALSTASVTWSFLDDKPDGRVLLDMPGYPYGQTDMMQEIDRYTYNELDNIDACKSNDPRMGQEPRGIAWADGRNTDLDGNPL